MNTCFKKLKENSYRSFILIYFLIILFMISFPGNNAGAQDMPLNGNERMELSDVNVQGDLNDTKEMLQIESLHKSYSERGDNAETKRLENEMEEALPPQNKISAGMSSDVYFESPSESGLNDWYGNDNMVHSGDIKSLPAYDNQLDLKYDDNNNLYAAINLKESPGLYSGKVAFYKSSNHGMSWTYAGAILTSVNVYITNISMLVESRSNDYEDSTRIILFYTKASNNNNNLSVLSFVTFRVNGTGYMSKDLYSSGVDREISHISAVSDGAYFQNATYFGVVCSESNSDFTITHNIRFFRTANWGNTWTGAAINTGANDFYPQSDFSISGSQLYIVAERRNSGGFSQIALIKTSWSPTSSHTSGTIGLNQHHEKPCITIRKNSAADSLIITSVNEGFANYFASYNGGTSFYGFNLGQTGNNYKYTHCVSANTGGPHFAAVYSTESGDTISIRRGYGGLMGIPQQKMNSVNYDLNIQPVCALCSSDINLPSILYAGNSGNAYFDQEGLKFILLKVVTEGLYNKATGRLNMKDTIRTYLRKSTAPFEIADSSISVIDSVSFYASFGVKNINSTDSYYFTVKHRNSIETWSSIPAVINTENLFYYDFTADSTRAYGKNLVRVNSSPKVYGIYSGDVNRDYDVNLDDLLLIHNNSSTFTSGYVSTDLNGDGSTNLTDIMLAYNNASAFVKRKAP